MLRACRHVCGARLCSACWNRFSYTGWEGVRGHRKAWQSAQALELQGVVAEAEQVWRLSFSAPIDLDQLIWLHRILFQQPPLNHLLYIRRWPG